MFKCKGSSGHYIYPLHLDFRSAGNVSDHQVLLSGLCDFCEGDRVGERWEKVESRREEGRGAGRGGEGGEGRGQRESEFFLWWVHFWWASLIQLLLGAGACIKSKSPHPNRERTEISCQVQSVQSWWLNHNSISPSVHTTYCLPLGAEQGAL